MNAKLTKSQQEFLNSIVFENPQNVIIAHKKGEERIQLSFNINTYLPAKDANRLHRILRKL